LLFQKSKKTYSFTKEPINKKKLSLVIWFFQSFEKCGYILKPSLWFFKTKVMNLKNHHENHRGYVLMLVNFKFWLVQVPIHGQFMRIPRPLIQNSEKTNFRIENWPKTKLFTFRPCFKEVKNK
jgi:hypothetical protein